MHLFITNADSPTGRMIVQKLSVLHQITASGTQSGLAYPERVRYVQLDLREPEQVRDALNGIDAIVHLTPLTITETSEDDAQDAIDYATRGTYVLMNMARQCSVAKMILSSSLALFDRFPAYYRVNEAWRPRPTASTGDLCAWLAELSARENARAGGLSVVCLRFGQIVDADVNETRAVDPRWLHIDDAIHGIECAISYLDTISAEQGLFWSVFHITAPGRNSKVRLENSSSAAQPFNYKPTHEFPGSTLHDGAQELVDRPWEDWLSPIGTLSRQIRSVVIFGAGGPVGAVVAQELSGSYRLRMVDLRPILDIIAEAKPQMPGAPLPQALGAPHEYTVVDVRDPQQVQAACEGMDAIINLSVVRHNQADAFRVNTSGAINIMHAAVKLGIRRVVQTGPFMHGTAGIGDYSADYDIADDAPARPYNQLYIHSKYLGQEACRVFAEQYGLEVPTLLFAAFINLTNPGSPMHTFAVTWEDSARAIKCALEVSALPSPYEVFNINSDTPLGRFNNTKAKTLLGWIPRDRMEHHWSEQ